MAKRAEATDRTRRRIEATLAQLLASKPYGAITMADIARESDVAVRTVQRHYPSKDNLLLHAYIGGPLEAVVEELSKGPLDKSPEEFLRSLVRAQFEFYDGHDPECQAIHSRAAEVLDLQEALRATKDGHSAHIDDMVARWPDAWSTDPKSVRRALLAMTSYPAWQALTQMGGMASLEAIKFVSDVLCRTLLRDF